MNLIINGLFGTTAATVFSGIIILLFICAIVLCLIRKDKRGWIISNAPGLLTSLGLFGTFCGVAIGLGEFNPQDIDSSVKNLLEGLKLAFWTSILGMLCAFLINLINFFIHSVSSEEIDEDEIGAAQIYEAIQQEKNELIKNIQDEQKILNQLLASIGGEKDSSLTNQVRLFRGDISDMKNEIIIEFREFAKTMAENSSKALIEALRDVIKDFNDKITEQFGDNFKELNRAVGALLEWQENYRNQIQELLQHFKTAQEGIASVQLSISQIKDNIETIPNTMQGLKTVVLALDAGIQGANTLLEGFVGLREQATQVFPEIKKGITELTDNFSVTVVELTQKIESNVTNSATTIENSVKTMESSVDTQNQAIMALGNRITELSTNLEKILKQSIDNIQKQFNNTLTSIETNLYPTIQRGINDMVFPVIKQGITELTQTTTNTVEKSTTKIENTVTKMEDSFNKQNNSITTLAEKIQNTTGDMIEKINKLDVTFDNGLKSLKSTFETTGNTISETTKKSFNTLNNEMENELKAAIKTMGSQLASVAQKLVDDYQTLTEKIAQLAEQAQRINRNRP